MNQQIKVPQFNCLIMEKNSLISSQSQVLPLKGNQANKILEGCNCQKELPGFYKTLYGITKK